MRHTLEKSRHEAGSKRLCTRERQIASSHPRWSTRKKVLPSFTGRYASIKPCNTKESFTEQSLKFALIEKSLRELVAVGNLLNILRGDR
jgi:hypothetical protein